MELRVGQRDRGLVGEQRERPMIGRGERADSGPALLVRDHEQADAAAAPVAFDGDRERVFRGRHHARRYRFDAGFVETGCRRRIDRLAGAAADRAGEREAAFVVQQVEGAAPGVQERNRAQQDLLGQFVQVQRRSDRQPHVVDRLQRDDVVVVLEPPVLQLVGQFPQPEADGQHSGEVVLLRRSPLSAASAVIASRIVDGRVVEDQAVLQAPFARAEHAPRRHGTAVAAVDLGASQALRPAPVPDQPGLRRAALPLRGLRRRRQPPEFGSETRSSRRGRLRRLSSTGGRRSHEVPA